MKMAIFKELTALDRASVSITGSTVSTQESYLKESTGLNSKCYLDSEKQESGCTHEPVRFCAFGAERWSE